MGGYAIGVNQAESDRARQFARKDQLTDEQHADQRKKYLGIRDNLQTQINSYPKDPKTGKVLPEYSDQYDKATAAQTQNEYNIGQLYDPIKAPGRLQADWHYLRERIHGIKPPVTTQAPAFNIPTPPAAPITLPVIPAYQQTDVSGLPSQGGKVTTTEVPGVAATTIQPMTSPTPDLSTGMQRRPPAAYVPAGSKVTVVKAPLAWKDRGTYQSPGELKQIAVARQKAQSDARMLEAGAPMSPEQTAEAQARGQAALRWGNLRADLAQWDKDNANASKDDRDAVASQLYEKYIGTTGKGNWKPISGTIPDPTDPNKTIRASYLYDSSTRQLSGFDGTPVLPQVAAGFRPDPTSSSANEQDFEKAVEDGYTGSRAQFRAEQAAKGRGDIAGIKFDPNSGQVIDSATGKRYSRNDTNLPPEVAKLFSSQQETAAEKQQKAIALVYARGQAMGASRYVMVAHPDGTVTYMSAGDASKSDAQSPAGIAFKTDAAMQRNLLGGGKIGQSILAYKTAAAHLDMLQQAADALNNGDVQFPNRTANAFNTAIGMPAPTNFDAIKAAVTGEIAKTFSTSVTLDDKAAILETISNAQSPAQIYGAIDTYRKLMLSKANAAEAMGTAASQGLADSFKGGTNTSPNSGGGNAPKSKGSRSLSAAMALPVNKGKSADEVQKHLESLGYTVTKP
jgi:hypothetical protein